MKLLNKHPITRNTICLALAIGATTIAAPTMAETVVIEEDFSLPTLDGTEFYGWLLYDTEETSNTGDPRTLWQRSAVAGGRAENSTHFGRNTRLIRPFDPVELIKPGDYLEVAFDFHFTAASEDAGTGFVAGFLELREPILGHTVVKEGAAQGLDGTRAFAVLQQSTSTNASLLSIRFGADGFLFDFEETASTENVSSINKMENSDETNAFVLRVTRTANGLEITGLHDGDEMNPLEVATAKDQPLKLGALFFSAQVIGGPGGALDNVKLTTNAK